MAVTINGSGTVTGLASGNAGVGKVLQVVSVTKTDVFSSSSLTFTDITGMTVTITPTKTSSKILIHSTFTLGNSASDAAVFINLVRNSTNIAQPSGGTEPSTISVGVMSAGQGTNSSIQFVDSPETVSATTYKLQGRVNGNTFYFNRAGTNANRTFVSTITVMEIAA